MKKVRIGELKAHLSKHLRAVRAGGEVVVFDRDTPIAKIVPYRPGRELVVRPAEGTLADLKLLAPPADFAKDIDIVAELLEERKDRF